MARVDTLSNYLTDVAEAIREKRKVKDQFIAKNFDDEIRKIQSDPEYNEVHCLTTNTGYTFISNEPIDENVAQQLSGGGSPDNDDFIVTLEKLPIWKQTIYFLGKVQPESISYWFNNVHNNEGMFITVYGLNLFDTSKCTDMSYAFANTVIGDSWGGSGLIELIQALDCSACINMEHMFESAQIYNNLTLDYNTSNVENMSSLFYDVDFYSESNLSGTWDTGNVINMNNLCEDVNEYNRLASLVENFDTIKVQTMNNAFDGANNGDVNLSSWNTSSLTSANNMFANANLSTITLTNFGSELLTDVTNFFSEGSYDDITIDGFITSDSDMTGFFGSNTPFSTLTLDNCTFLEKEDFAQFMNAVSNDNITITNLSLPKAISLSNFFGQEKVENSEYSINLDISKWNIPLVTDCSFLFKNCNFSNYDLETWKTNLFANVESMFDYADLSYKELNLTLWDTKNITNAKRMFANAQFYNTTGYKGLLLKDFGSDKLTDVTEFFNECSAGDADISVEGFTTADTTMTDFFYGIDASNLIFTNANILAKEDFSNGQFLQLWNIWDSADLSHLTVAAATKLSDFINTEIINNDNLTLILDNFSAPIATSLTGFINGNSANKHYISLDNFSAPLATNLSIFVDNVDERERIQITSANGWNIPSATDLSYAFDYVTIDDIALNTWTMPKAEKLYYMFRDADIPATILDDFSWDDRVITDTSYMFYNCYNINFNINWDEQEALKLTNMEFMFAGTDITNLSMNNFNAPLLTNMSGFLCYARNLDKVSMNDMITPVLSDISGMFATAGKTDTNYPLDISINNLNATKLTNMDHLFEDSHIKNIDLSTWGDIGVASLDTLAFEIDVDTFNLSDVNFINLTDFSYIIDRCDISTLLLNNLNLPKVTNISDITTGNGNSPDYTDWFGYSICEDLNYWNNTTNGYSRCTLGDIEIGLQTKVLNTLSTLFYESNGYQNNITCQNWNLGGKITKLNLDFIQQFIQGSDWGSQWLTPSTVTFKNVTLPSITEITNDTSFGPGQPISDWDVDLVVEGFNAPLLKTVPDCNFYDWDNITINGCNCPELLNFPKYENNLTTLDIQDMTTPKANLDNFINSNDYTSVIITKWDCSKVTSASEMFLDFSGSLNINYAGWKLDSLQNADSMFQQCPAITEVNFDGFNTPKLKSANYMYSDCDNLTSVTISNWNVPVLTSMNSMFEGCDRLANVNITKLNTPALTDVDSMFTNCIELDEVIINDWTSEMLNTAENMFNADTQLSTLTITKWTTPKLNSINSIFYDCDLSNTTITDWDCSSLSSAISAFESCALTNISITNWTCPVLSDASNMFAYCSIDGTIDLSSLASKNISNMNMMFFENTILDTVNFENWDSSLLNNVEQCFYDCYELETIYTDKDFSFESASGDNTFGYCNVLENATTGYSYNNNGGIANASEGTTWKYFTYDGPMFDDWEPGQWYKVEGDWENIDGDVYQPNNLGEDSSTAYGTVYFQVDKNCTIILNIYGITEGADPFSLTDAFNSTGLDIYLSGEFDETYTFSAEVGKIYQLDIQYQKDGSYSPENEIMTISFSKS